ncbi:MAG: UDP-N-acetylmuramate dehydrogenase [Clostridia bacterium]|nr:UDP-N-acetylmuramate dehydrogenase [Clostridia bacterium]
MPCERLSALREALRERFPDMALRERVPLSECTTLRLGGPADLMAEPSSPEELRLTLAMAAEAGVPVMVLGRGSNVLFRDGGFRGLIVRVGRAMSAASVSGERITAQAGAALMSLSALAQRSGLAGLAFACGIPGTIGGGLCMNAGAYGGELKQVTALVRGCTMAGEPFECAGEDCGFGYRTSRIKREGLIVTEAVLRLSPGDPEEIQAEMQRLLAARSEKQPLDLPSAGSTFKRPSQGYAAQLIDECGLKGLRVGGAEVSRKHAGFLVSRGGTAADFEQLMAQVADIVQREKGIRLEPEVIIAGEN